jgi:putative ABC transport system permease protein
MSLTADIRVALRSLKRRPGFVTAAVATLALGIGANTAIFGIVNAVLLEPLPFSDPERLVVLSEENTREGRQDDVSASNFMDFRESQSLAGMAAWRQWGFALTGSGEPRELAAVRASANIFQVLGVSPSIGRGFDSTEEAAGRDQVAVISDGFWRESMGADPAVLGRTIVLDGKPHRVIGVMPAAFRFPDDQSVALWVPLSLADHEREYRAQRMFNVIGRLGPGRTLAQAEGEIRVIADRLSSQYPETNGGWSARLASARDVLVGSQRPLVILLVAVSLVLAIACVNLVNLLLARGADRRKEIAVRVALGAGRGNIMRQLVLESLLLGVAGGAAGLLLALWGMRLFVVLEPGIIPAWNEVSLDWRVLFFGTAAALLSSLVSGLLPARQVLRSDLNSSLKDAGNLSAGPVRQRLRQALVVSEVALAFILVVGAGLLIHSLYRLQQVDPGFRSDRLIVSSVSLAETRYPDETDQHTFFQRLLESLSAHPDIDGAALVTTLPMNPVGIDHDMGYVVAGAEPAGEGQEPQADFRIASAGYFTLLGVPLRSGREFSSQDREGAPRVMVVNETMARIGFPDGRPLGKKVTTGGFEFEVVGVVADVHHRGLDQAPRPEMFVAEPQIYSYGNMSVVVRGRSEESGAAAIKQAVAAIDRDQPIGAVTTVGDLLSDSVSRRRFNLILLSIFAAVGTALAAIGIYGVIAYSVGQRTRELGIRSALGANHASLMGLVLGSGLRLAAVGIGLGLGGAVALTRLLQSQLFQLSPLDPIAFGGTGLLLGLVALGASWIPARRTLKVDPLTALRHE